ncbi:hypothetical protein Pr1d_49960 [Bythopirellula goksoeyrii]|uniref:Uncharacterized protein n=1 Tax=Bythopirellula goksoeyrii TaxID=1400387 RepID=A0A5B9QJ94_9BACT|nr:hypothetical protein Pr1d_49960 [Bythopirellula goksoeyrii]
MGGDSFTTKNTGPLLLANEARSFRARIVWGAWQPRAAFQSRCRSLELALGYHSAAVPA